jgi:hypothetical protein
MDNCFVDRGFYVSVHQTRFTHRREQVAPAPDCANDGWASRIGLDLPPKAHDPQVNGAVEGFGVACIGKLQEPIA